MNEGSGDFNIQDATTKAPWKEWQACRCTGYDRGGRKIAPPFILLSILFRSGQLQDGDRFLVTFTRVSVEDRRGDGLQLAVRLRQLAYPSHPVTPDGGYHLSFARKLNKAGKHDRFCKRPTMFT